MPDFPCPVCNQLIPVGARTCESCGARLTDGLEVTNLPKDEVLETTKSLAGEKRNIQKKVSELEPYLREAQVNPADQSNALLLQQIITNEGKSRLPEHQQTFNYKPFWRILFAGFLILAITISLIPGLLDFRVNYPDANNEAITFFQYVQGIWPGAPVLVSVDYQPALTGEMESVAGPIITHLLSQGAYLVLVSTQPTGPIQAERLIDVTRQKTNQMLIQPAGYTNLGYIPGASTGLRTFAEHPHDMIPTGIDGRLAWQEASLQNISRLSDFAQVIVITDNLDTVRAWVEQVQPLLGQSPLLMALSAQVAPLALPYYEAPNQQIQGMVSGMAGGAAYEALTNRPWKAGEYWIAFNIGVFVAFLLIVAGGIYFAIQSQQDKRGQESYKEGVG